MAKPRDLSLSKRLGEARFRVTGHRNTLERLNESAERSAWLDVSRAEEPIFLLRQRRKHLEIGKELRFGGKALLHLKPQASETSSKGESPLRTHYKTILSLDLDLHAWQQNLKESELRIEMNQRKTGSLGPLSDRSLLLKPHKSSLSLVDSLRNAPSPHLFVLSQEQKRQLSQEIVRVSALKTERNHQVVQLRPHIGSSPTTYRVRTQSLAIRGL